MSSKNLKMQPVRTYQPDVGGWLEHTSWNVKSLGCARVLVSSILIYNLLIKPWPHQQTLHPVGKLHSLLANLTPYRQTRHPDRLPCFFSFINLYRPT